MLFLFLCECTRVQRGSGTHRIWTFVRGWSSTAQHEREGVGLSGWPLKTNPARRTGIGLHSPGSGRLDTSVCSNRAAFSPPDTLGFSQMYITASLFLMLWEQQKKS